MNKNELLPPRCLIATSQLWTSTASLSALVNDVPAKVVMFCPNILGFVCDFKGRVNCSRDPWLAAQQLQSYLESEFFDLVIIADDDLLCALLERPNLNGSTKFLPIDPLRQAAMALVASKHSFIESAHTLGLPVPRYRFAGSTDEAIAIANEIGYPVILKGDHGFAGLQVRRAVDSNSVRRRSRGFLKRYSRILIQKEVYGVAVSACVLYDKGRVSALKSFYAECEFPKNFSPSTVHQFFTHPTIEDIARRIGAETGFHGLAGIDFMYDASTNDLFVIEFNPRPTIGFGGAIANRQFFSAPMRRLLYGMPLTSAEIYDGKEATQCYFPSYIFYTVGRLKKIDMDRLRLCLNEFQPRAWKIVLWELLRFLGGRLKLATAPGRYR